MTEKDEAFITLKNFIDWYAPTKEMNYKLIKMLGILSEEKITPDFIDFLNMLSLRSKYSIRNSKINSLEELTEKFKNFEILKIRNMGKKSVEEIEERLKEIGKLEQDWDFDREYLKISNTL